MIALDTNILVYAHREDSPHHERAVRAVESVANSERHFAIPWPCVHEFLSIVTHPRIYDPPTPVATAAAAMATLLELPGAVALGEGPKHFSILSALLENADVRGPKVHDARIAAICLAQGVTELWTADRDFSFFPTLVTRNPFVG